MSVYTGHAGDTLLLQRPGYDFSHLFIQVTEPAGNPPQVVIVALSTKRFGSDCTVVLAPGEHAWVRHQSIVFYHHATLTEVRNLRDAVTMGVGVPQARLSDAVLRRVQEGVASSPFTPNRIKAFCRGALGV